MFSRNLLSLFQGSKTQRSAISPGLLAGLAELTSTSARPGTVTFGVTQASGVTHFSWPLKTASPPMARERSESPDLEVLMSEETWWALADGTVTPLDVFGQGHIRLLGEVALARSLVAAVTGHSG